VSVWPAITEAMYLLAMWAEAQDALWDMLQTRAVVLASLDLADAALVRVAEREKIRTVFTVDRRDVEAYRPSRAWRFTIVPA